jgi:hypothetical protein
MSALKGRRRTVELHNQTVGIYVVTKEERRKKNVKEKRVKE